jgi:hypothetical protein
MDPLNLDDPKLKYDVIARLLSAVDRLVEKSTGPDQDSFKKLRNVIVRLNAYSEDELNEIEEMFAVELLGQLRLVNSVSDVTSKFLTAITDFDANHASARLDSKVKLVTSCTLMLTKDHDTVEEYREDIKTTYHFKRTCKGQLIATRVYGAEEPLTKSQVQNLYKSWIRDLTKLGLN